MIFYNSYISLVFFLFLLGHNSECTDSNKTIMCKEFNFITFEIIDELKDVSDYDSYYVVTYNGKNEISRISRFDRLYDLNNYEFYVSYLEEEAIYSFEGILYYDVHHVRERSTPLIGVILLDKISKDLYLIKTIEISKISDLRKSVGNIKEVFNLNEFLYPKKKISFNKGFFSYKTEFEYFDNKDLIEHLYLFNREACSKESIEFRTFNQVENIYFNSDCDLKVGAVSPLVRNKKIPLWIYGDYQYGE